MIRMICGVLVFCCVVGMSAPALAMDLKLGLGDIPGQSERDEQGNLTGGYVEVALLLQQAYTESTLELSGPYPLERALGKLEKGELDAHLPLIIVEEKDQQYTFAGTPLFSVQFSLFTMDDSPALDTGRLGSHRVEIQKGMDRLLDFEAMEGYSIATSLARLQKGLIEGYIMETSAAEDYITNHKLQGIRSTLYKVYDAGVVIPKGARGEAIDKVLNPLITRIKAMPEYAAIIKKLGAQ